MEKENMEDRITCVRNHILGMLERGELKGGDKLPGARELMQKEKISLPTVQSAIEILVHEGVLETFPRRGTFVQAAWRLRTLQQNLVLFRPRLEWLDELWQLARREVPEVWISDKFAEGIFELRTTQYVQAYHNQYADLSRIFESCFPDKSDFFLGPFEAFRINSRLVGVPVIYSPRVLFYNPALLKRAGCSMPHPGWTIEEFFDCIRRLRRILPPEDIFCWHDSEFGWINFVLRAGGGLIDPASPESVKIDSAETRLGLKIYRDLRRELGILQYRHYPDEFETRFFAGQAAMLIEPRQFLCRIRSAGFEEWDTVPLPRIGNGPDVNVQATDLFCVRRECVNPELAARLLKLLLSVEFQNCLARKKYGIPIRKSSIGNSIDYTDARDVLFLSEIPKMQSCYHLNSVELYTLVCDGISNLLVGDEDIDAGTAELAEMVRTCLKIRKVRQNVLNMYPDVGRTEILNSPLSAG